ncbi:MAG TPA: aminodeoxychorismate synthase component I [Chryseolinea sp.]
MNRLGQQKVPFLFLIDFEMKKPFIVRLNEVDPTEILFSIHGFTNAIEKIHSENIAIEKSAGSLVDYKKKFDKVLDHLAYGDSFLTNLTVKTELKLAGSLQDVFYQSEAKYKLLFKNQFLVFSPETFVQIRDGKIYAYPMKGTIDASVVNAREKILSDQKELAEHVTIVDLIRNDLSQVASRVVVSRFRYIEEVRSRQKNLLQVSSEIYGWLDRDYKNHLGDILLKLLPAGSVSGAPKPKTLEIIRDVEGEARGYYTGVFGYFNGKDLDCGVMIRFIEKAGMKYFYRSGGGITTQSDVESEYRETIDKVYVPVA